TGPSARSSPRFWHHRRRAAEHLLPRLTYNHRVMRIDLHSHSSVSDGTDTPAEVIGYAVAAGLDILALTDHDTVGGIKEAAEHLPPGFTLVPGMRSEEHTSELQSRFDLVC